MRQFLPVHLAHQILNLVSAHRHAAQGGKFQRRTHQQHTQPVHQRHVSSLAAAKPHGECRSDDRSTYRELLAGGARKRTSERSATDCSWQRTAVRLTTVMTTAGITSHSGVRTTAPTVDAAVGANAANTTTAIQRTTTVLRVRGIVVTANH